MNGDMHCPFRLHVRFLDAISVVRWSAVEALPRYGPSNWPWTKHKRRMHGTYQECADGDGDCLKRHHLQLWGTTHSLDFANLSELLGIEAPTRSGPYARPEKQRTAIAQTVCEESRR
jgi:hypothetical protein